jgi:hypothetical protein
VAFYKSASSNDIIARFANAEAGAWSDEETVTIGSTVPQTDRAVAVTPMILTSSLGERLYVFYKQAGTNDIKYFRLTHDLELEGPWTIPPSLAQTDRGPAAATQISGDPPYNVVLFKSAGSNDLRQVRRVTDPVGFWETAANPPFPSGTDGDPYLTCCAGEETMVATVKQPDGAMAYALHGEICGGATRTRRILAYRSRPASSLLAPIMDTGSTPPDR